MGRPRRTRPYPEEQEPGCLGVGRRLRADLPGVEQVVIPGECFHPGWRIDVPGGMQAVFADRLATQRFGQRQELVGRSIWSITRSPRLHLRTRLHLGLLRVLRDLFPRQTLGHVVGRKGYTGFAQQSPCCNRVPGLNYSEAVQADARNSSQYSGWPGMNWARSALLK